LNNRPPGIQAGSFLLPRSSARRRALAVASAEIIPGRDPSGRRSEAVAERLATWELGQTFQGGHKADDVIARRRRKNATPAFAILSSGIVEDDPDRVPHAGADTAHAMAQVHTIVPLRTPHGAIVDREGNGIALAKRHDLDAALHARPLLGQSEFAAREVPTRF